MRLSLEQIISYQTEGYLIVPDVLDGKDLQPVIEELEREIDGRARRLFAEGKLKALYETEPFERRYACLYGECPEIGKGLDIQSYLGEAMFRLLGHGKLLDVAECLLGSELSCNPIQHVRAKVREARRGRTGLFSKRAVASRLRRDVAGFRSLGDHHVLDAARGRDGGDGLHGSHAARIQARVHQSPGRGRHDDRPDKLPDAKPALAECPKGGLVIMNKYTPHRGIGNRSDIVRWSIDLRYHKTGAPSGRSFQPSFPVRSASEPDGVLRDAEEWRRLWQAVKDEKDRKMHRV